MNGFRHSRAKNIEIELGYWRTQLQMRVRDDGRGIDPDILQSGREGHWGLSGMRERAEGLGGRLSVKSAPAAPTVVTVEVPVRPRSSKAAPPPDMGNDASLGDTEKR